jgi:hypothetical protein
LTTTLLDADETLLTFYGASITEKINKYTTHIIVDTDDISRLRLLDRGLKTLKKQNKNADLPIGKCCIVKRSWVTESVNSHDDLHEGEFAFSPEEIDPASSVLYD